MIARMKLVPVHSLIRDKKLLFVDDSIVRGTQLHGTVDFLLGCGAKELHIRSACPPVLYGCKYLNFSRSTLDSELISRQAMYALEGSDGEKHIDEYADSSSSRYRDMIEAIREKLNLTTLAYHSLDGMTGAIGIDKCKLCTYCWSGND